MCRSALLFLLGVVGLCAAQSMGGDTAEGNSTTRDTCEGSTVDFCLRTCCPPGQNYLQTLDACATATISWEPSFMSAEVNFKVTEGPIPKCASNEEQKVFYPHLDESIQFDIQPSGELNVLTSKGAYDPGHKYCFRNIELGGKIYESVRSCVPRVVPQVPGLVSIDNVTEVSFRKCCPVDQMLVVNETTHGFVCVNSSSNWLPSVLHGDPTKLTQLSPEKAKVEAAKAFKCPRKTITHYLLSASAEFYLEATSRLLAVNINETIAPHRFCLDLLQSSSPKPQVLAQICYDDAEEHTQEKFEELCPEGVCVRKCCESGFILSNLKCTRSGEDRWQPTFHDGEQVVSGPANYSLLHGRSECHGTRLPLSKRIDEVNYPLLQTSGVIKLPGLYHHYEAHQCCLDNGKYYDQKAHKYVMVETAICCVPKDWEYIIVGYVRSTLLSISVICLFVMLVIYAVVPDLRNIHGKCLMSHAAALFIAFFSNVMSFIISLELGPSCDALALLLYYSFIAALFWLNVMSFDIWWTFAHLRTQAPSQRSLRNRFIRHSIYAWGVPLLMTVMLAFLNYAPENIIPKGAILRPDIGKRKCFISGQKQELYYFYIPIFIVTGVNIIFFAATAWTLYQAEKSSRILNRKRTARDRLKVYVNLFIIMEVSWIAECLSTQVGPVQAWYFTDIINASQGLLIFILFIARHATRQTIRERFAELRKRGVFNPHPVAKTDGAAAQPTKTTGTTITNSSSATRKSSETEAYQMTEKKSTAETNGNGVAGTASSNGDVTADGEEPSPEDCAC